MIVRETAEDITGASREVTRKLLAIRFPDKPVLIKPNLVEPSLPPATTDVRVVAGVIAALEEAGINDITVAEGSGTGDTGENFHKLGYATLGVPLVDLDREEPMALPVSTHRVWNTIMIPAMLVDKFIISVPVLKEHSLCGVTASLKNMVGILPSQYYSGYWSYKKSQIHKYDTHGCIADLISILSPDMAIVDASVGMKGHHLSGTPHNPPLNIIYGSHDPLEADKFGCSLLGKNWEDIRYLALINDQAIDSAATPRRRQKG